MALTSLSCYLKPPPAQVNLIPDDDLIEYCRNERGKDVVGLYIVPDPSDASVTGETVTISLYKARRGRDEEVTQAQTEYTFTGPIASGGVLVEFNLRTITYDNTKRWPIIRRGNYYFKVEHTGGTTGPSSVSTESDDFRVTLYSVDRLDRDLLFGITRKANEERATRFQPSRITGVKVIEISPNHPAEEFSLRFIAENSPSTRRYLAWDNGEQVLLDTNPETGRNKSYILINHSRDDYIVVKVDPTLLPNVDTTEFLVVDQRIIERETIRNFIDDEIDRLEQSELYTPLEPALIVSDYSIRDMSPSAGSQGGPSTLPENYDYDIMANPISYYHESAGHWIGVNLPYGPPLHVDYFVGALENSRIVDIRTEWVHSSAARYIELVPFNQSLAYHFIGLIYTGTLRNVTGLPSMWRYRYWAGLRDETTPRDVLEVIGLRAAIKAAVVLGQAYRGGISSTSVSRDGVSISESYTSSAMYGIYSSSIEAFSKRLESLESKIKRRYFGINMAVV